MAEAMDTSERDVSSDEDGEYDFFVSLANKAVLPAIHKFFIDSKHCDVTLEAGIDKKQ